MIQQTAYKIQKRLVLAAALLACLFGMANGSAWAEESTQVIKAETIRENAHRFLLRELAWGPNRMNLDVEYKGGDVKVPKGPVEFDFRLPGSKNRAGKVPFSLMIRVDKIVKHRARLDANVEVIYDVVQTTESLERGHIISEGDVELVQIPSMRPMRNIMTRIDDVIGQKVVRSIGHGQSITNFMIKREHTVKRGDRILLVAEKGPLRITAPGLVQENGFKDAIVKVQNLQSHKTVYGTVVDSKTVKVEF